MPAKELPPPGVKPPRHRTMTVRQIAEEMQRTRAWFYKHRRQLERDHAFPKPIPGSDRLWSRERVMAWIEADREGGTPPESYGSTVETVLWSKRLRERSAHLVAALDERLDRRRRRA